MWCSLLLLAPSWEGSAQGIKTKFGYIFAPFDSALLWPKADSQCALTTHPTQCSCKWCTQLQTLLPSPSFAPRSSQPIAQHSSDPC